MNTTPATGEEKPETYFQHVINRSAIHVSLTIFLLRVSQMQQQFKTKQKTHIINIQRICLVNKSI